MMKPKARYSARYGYAPALLLPPKLETIGPLPFGEQEFAELDAWLAQDGWPLEHMDVATIEGYLVALLVWPIELSSGAWLPPLWGVGGWKVAAKIETPEAYGRFIALVIGYLQELERRLTCVPPHRTPVLGCDGPAVSASYFAGSAWATGFMTALFRNSAGLHSRSVASRTAVETIASYASLRSAAPSAMPVVGGALSAAVAVLIAERASRGPLGPLNVVDVSKLKQRSKLAAGAVGA
jgi:yecA family protein